MYLAVDFYPQFWG